MKVVAIVLVAIAMLFVVALALGSNRHDTTARTDDTGFFSHLQAGRFLQAQGDVSASGCANVSPGVVVVSTGACTLDVPARGRFARPTRYALKDTGPAAIGVRVLPRRNGPDLDQSLNSGDCLGGALDQKGGTIVLGPLATGQTAVSLLTERCP